MTNSVMQYNYSHDNAGPGLQTAQYDLARDNWGGNVIRYNVSQNDARKNAYGGMYLYGGSGVQNLDVYHNTVFISPGANCDIAAVRANATGANVRVRNNIFYTTGGVKLGDLDSNTVDFEGNAYWGGGASFKLESGGTTYTSLAGWRSAKGQERSGTTATGMFVDPKLAAAGAGGTINCAGALRHPVRLPAPGRLPDDQRRLEPRGRPARLLRHADPAGRRTRHRCGRVVWLNEPDSDPDADADANPDADSDADADADPASGVGCGHHEPDAARLHRLGDRDQVPLQRARGASLSAADLVVRNSSGTAISSSAMRVAYDAATHIATWTFPGLANAKLSSGTYSVQLPDQNVTDAAGNRLAGGVDIRFNFNTSGAATWGSMGTDAHAHADADADADADPRRPASSAPVALQATADAFVRDGSSYANANYGAQRAASAEEGRRRDEPRGLREVRPRQSRVRRHGQAAAVRQDRPRHRAAGRGGLRRVEHELVRVGIDVEQPPRDRPGSAGDGHRRDEHVEVVRVGRHELPPGPEGRRRDAGDAGGAVAGDDDAVHDLQQRRSVGEPPRAGGDAVRTVLFVEHRVGGPGALRFGAAPPGRRLAAVSGMPAHRRPRHAGGCTRSFRSAAGRAPRRAALRDPR